MQPISLSSLCSLLGSLPTSPTGGLVPPSLHTHSPFHREEPASQGGPHRDPSLTSGTQNGPMQLAGQPSPHSVTQQNLDESGEEVVEQESQARPHFNSSS